MNRLLKKPSSIFSKEFLEKVTQREEEFEKFRFPDGSLAEGVVGNMALISHSDYEYGYVYLVNTEGEDFTLDFGTFEYYHSLRHPIQFKLNEHRPKGKDCFNGPFFKRLYLDGEPTDKVLYYGFWADCYCDMLDDEIVSQFHPFERVYTGGVIECGKCNFIGEADYDTFTETLLTPNILLTKFVDCEADYRYAMYPDFYDEEERVYRESADYDPWTDRKLYGAYDLRLHKQIISNNLYKIESRNEHLFLYGCKESESQIYLSKHPRKTIGCVQYRLDKLPYCFEPWRPSLIESPEYFEEEHGIINIAPYAGRDIFDLIGENKDLLLSLVRRNFFHLDTGVIEYWEEEYKDLISQSFFDKLYIANDAHHIYWDIFNASDKFEILGSSVLVFSKRFGSKVQLLTTLKHGSHKSFKTLIVDDFPYIQGLVKLRRVFVSSDVLRSLLDSISPDYVIELKNLIRFVQAWEDERNHIEELEEYERNQHLLLQEEEDYEQMYRDAFDGNPDAEWNID